MNPMTTYAMLAVVATWPVFALDTVPSSADTTRESAVVSQAADVPATPLAVTPSQFDTQPPLAAAPPAPPAPPAPAAPPAPPAAAAPRARTPAPAPVPPPAPAAPPAVAGQPAPPVAPRAPRHFVNVDIELSLTERGDASAAPRTVRLRVVDDESAQFRQDLNDQASMAIDVRPTLVDTTRTNLSLALEFSQVVKVGDRFDRRQMRTRVDVVVRNGEPTTVSQWSDPSVNRTVELVVKATQLR